LDRTNDIEIKFIQGVYAIPRTLDTRETTKATTAEVKHHDLKPYRNDGPEAFGLEL
jgi:hypothetical protein